METETQQHPKDETCADLAERLQRAYTALDEVRALCDSGRLEGSAFVADLRDILARASGG